MTIDARYTVGFFLLLVSQTSLWGQSDVVVQYSIVPGIQSEYAVIARFNDLFKTLKGIITILCCFTVYIGES